MKKFNIKVNGKSYEVEVEEVGGTKSSIASRSKAINRPAPKAVPAKKTEPEASQASKKTNASGEAVSSPMPGKILKIIKSEGSQVKAGEVILILEAMKMENEITAPRDGEVAEMTVSDGSTVQSGEKLFIVN